MSKKRVIGVFLLGALVAAGALVATGVTAQEQGTEEGTSDEFVRVSANGAVDAEADATEVTLAVEARADDPSAARQRVAENASGMRDALGEVGVSDDGVHSVGYTLRESREYERAEGDDVQAKNAKRVYGETV